jgi:uncharacterized protein (TIGR02453 family)
VTTFAGFTDRAVGFYAGLEADNTRDYWAAHKTVYETEVRDPMRAMLDQLEEEFGAAKLFRPHRDVRFSHDKTPYKTHQAAFVGTTVGIGYYVHLDAGGLLAGGGWRAHGSGQVERFRAAVDDDATGTQLAEIMVRLRGDGFDLEGEQLKTRPRGYAADHPRLDLLRCRSLMLAKPFGTPPWLGDAGALDEVRAAWRQVRPLTEWVAAHVDDA